MHVCMHVVVVVIVVVVVVIRFKINSSELIYTKLWQPMITNK